MAHRCYISFKMEDRFYKEKIQNLPGLDMIDKSLDEKIDSKDEEYILRTIREGYLSDSTVTIFLIGKKSAEDLGYDEQVFIKRELQASLYDGKANSRNGILGIVLPNMQSTVFKGQYTCNECGGMHNGVFLNNSTVIKEFWYNYYIPNGKCAHTEEERYCVAVSWNDFESNPNTYIDQAFTKRSSDIANKVKVYP
jgi:hypothetical protein